MEPLRIVCQVSGTARKAGDRYQSLDGILAYAVASEVTEGKPYRLHGLPAITMPLPLMVIEGLPICSVLSLCGDRYSDTDWALRRPRDGSQTALVKGRLAKVDERGGPDQPRRVPIAVHLGFRYEALCIGNCEAIAELLQTVTHIGPRADIGYGEVERWEVYPSNATVAEVLTTKMNGETVLSRPVPVSLQHVLEGHGIAVDAGESGFGCWRPPYWHRDGYEDRWSYQTPAEVLC